MALITAYQATSHDGARVYLLSLSQIDIISSTIGAEHEGIQPPTLQHHLEIVNSAEWREAIAQLADEEDNIANISLMLVSLHHRQISMTKMPAAWHCRRMPLTISNPSYRYKPFPHIHHI